MRAFFEEKKTTGKQKEVILESGKKLMLTTVPKKCWLMMRF